MKKSPLLILAIFSIVLFLLSTASLIIELEDFIDIVKHYTLWYGQKPPFDFLSQYILPVILQLFLVFFSLSNALFLYWLSVQTKRNKTACTTGDIAKGKTDRRERKRKNRIASLQRQLSELEGDGDKHIDQG